MRTHLIWSNEHGAWWRPGQRGYTNSLSEAGRYTEGEAQSIVARSTFLDLHRTNPMTGEAYTEKPEVIIPAPVSTIAVRDTREVTVQDLLAGDLMAACIDRGIDLDPNDRNVLRQLAGQGSAAVETFIGLIGRTYAAGGDSLGDVQVIEHEGRGLKVISTALHDRLCKARVATPQGTDPEVLGCALCGFCYPLQQQGGVTRGNS